MPETNIPLPDVARSPHQSGSPRSHRLQVNEHPSTNEAREIREKNHAFAHRMLLILNLLLVFTALGSAYLHLCSSDVGEQVGVKFLGTNYLGMLQRLKLDPTNSVQLDNAGRVASISALDVRWCVGQDNASTVIAGLQERSDRINQLIGRTVDRALLEFTVRFNSGALSGNTQTNFALLNKDIRAGDFREAA